MYSAADDHYKKFIEKINHLLNAIEECDLVNCKKALNELKREKYDWKIYLKDFFPVNPYNKPIDDVINIIMAIQSDLKESNRVFSPNYLSPALFFQLLFERPEFVYELLQIAIKSIKNFSLKLDLSTIPQEYNYVGTAVNSAAFLKCVSLLSTFPSDNPIVSNETLLATLIQRDQSYAVAAFSQSYSPSILTNVLFWDSFKTFALLYNLWVKIRDVNEKDEKKISFFIQEAIQFRAYHCLQFLLKRNPNLSPQVMLEFIKLAANTGDTATLLVLNHNDVNKASDFLFSDYKNSVLDNDLQIKLTNLLLKLMRFSTLDEVQKLFVAFLDHLIDKKQNQLFSDIYKKTQAQFQALAPYFSRYSKARSLIEITSAYKNNETIDNIDKFVVSDLEFGAKRMELAIKLSTRIKSDEKLIPKGADFKKLPKSSTGNQMAATLLEEIADFSSKNAKDDKVKFSQIRDKGYRTPMNGRYTWGAILASCVYYFSKADDLKRQPLRPCCQLIYHIKTLDVKTVLNFTSIETISNEYSLDLIKNKNQLEDKIYIQDTKEGLEYEVLDPEFKFVKGVISWNELPLDFPRSAAKIIANQEKYSPFVLNITAALGLTPLTFTNLWWCHGQAPLHSTWQDVEDLFEKVLTMPITPIGRNTETNEIEYDVKELQAFYATIAELVWLIGNTQPLRRGTGTYVEELLGILTKSRELPQPILKVKYPQIDVLDITFPLSDYKYFFPYFFERQSLPMQMRPPELSDSLSLFDEVKEIYQRKHAGLANIIDKKLQEEPTEINESKKETETQSSSVKQTTFQFPLFDPNQSAANNPDSKLVNKEKSIVSIKKD